MAVLFIPAVLVSAVPPWPLMILLLIVVLLPRLLLIVLLPYSSLDPPCLPRSSWSLRLFTFLLALYRWPPYPIPFRFCGIFSSSSAFSFLTPSVFP